MTSNWTMGLIERLKSQKTRTDQQELVVILHEKVGRTAENNMELNVLLKAERAKERSKAAEAAAIKLLGAHKDNARKARNHRLIEQGLLIEFAGLGERSKGEILGGLMALAQSGADKWASWKQSGDVLLSRREKNRATDKVEI